MDSGSLGDSPRSHNLRMGWGGVSALSLRGSPWAKRQSGSADGTDDRNPSVSLVLISGSLQRLDTAVPGPLPPVLSLG